MRKIFTLATLITLPLLLSAQNPWITINIDTGQFKGYGVLSHADWQSPVYDTIPAILMVLDTTVAYIPEIDRDTTGNEVIWEHGFVIRKWVPRNSYITNTGIVQPGTWHPIGYLTRQRKPLPKGYVVWQYLITK